MKGSFPTRWDLNARVHVHTGGYSRRPTAASHCVCMRGEVEVLGLKCVVVIDPPYPSSDWLTPL